MPDLPFSIALREAEAIDDTDLYAGDPMQDWNSTPAYPTTLVLMLTGFGVICVAYVTTAIAELWRGRRRRGRRPS